MNPKILMTKTARVMFALLLLASRAGALELLHDEAEAAKPAEAKAILVVHQVMKDKEHTAAAAYKVGAVHKLKLERFDTHPELDKIFRLEGTDDPDMVPYWAVEVVEEKAGAPGKPDAGKKQDSGKKPEAGKK